VLIITKSSGIITNRGRDDCDRLCGAPRDIEDKIDGIMQMGKEHFKPLAKQFGKRIYDN